MSRKIDGSGMKARMLGLRCWSTSSRATPRVISSWVTRSSGWKPGSRASEASPRQRQGWPRIERWMLRTVDIHRLFGPGGSACRAASVRILDAGAVGLDKALNPRLFAEPFGDDVLRPLDDPRALVERVVVRRAVGHHVVPDQQQAALGLEADAGAGKPGGAAFLYLIEIGHRRPGALAAGLHHALPIAAILVEIVAMRAELLVGGVALALERLGILGQDAEQIGDPLVDRRNLFGPAIEIGAVAGAVIRIVARRQQGGRTRIGVDQGDQRVALGIAQKIGIGVHLRRFDPGALDMGVRLQPGGHVAPDLRALGG